MSVCTHPPSFHFEGETCRQAEDLKPGDQLRVLSGGSALARVLDATPAEKGWTSVVLDVCWDGPTMIASDTVMTVRPVDGLTAQEQPEPEPETEIRVALEITEEAIHEVELTLHVPIGTAASNAALRDYLSTDWGLFSDVLGDSKVTVNNQQLTRAEILRKGPVA